MKNNNKNYYISEPIHLVLSISIFYFGRLITKRIQKHERKDSTHLFLCYCRG
jgi:hypothetical protein